MSWLIKVSLIQRCPLRWGSTHCKAVVHSKLWSHLALHSLNINTWYYHLLLLHVHVVTQINLHTICCPFSWNVLQIGRRISPIKIQVLHCQDKHPMLAPFKRTHLLFDYQPKRTLTVVHSTLTYVDQIHTHTNLSTHSTTVHVDVMNCYYYYRVTQSLVWFRH